MEQPNRGRIRGRVVICLVTLVAVISVVRGLRSESVREFEASACLSLTDNVCFSGTAPWAGASPTQAVILAVSLPRVDVSKQYEEGAQCASDPLAMSVELRRECGITTPVDTYP
jgi:uncharacterized membrane protein